MDMKIQTKFKLNFFLMLSRDMMFCAQQNQEQEKQLVLSFLSLTKLTSMRRKNFNV